MPPEAIDVLSDASDVYAPPAAQVVEPPTVAAAMEFHVVGATKFFVLYGLTFGLYQVYWFYKQWTQYRRCHRASMVPVLRAIFPVFFTHSLVDKVDARLRRNGSRSDWNSGTLATAFVILQLLSTIMSRLAGDAFGAMDVATLFCNVIIAVILWRIQLAINLACGDPTGEANSRFTAANAFWVVLGGLAWMLVLASIALALLGPIPVDIALPP